MANIRSTISICASLERLETFGQGHMRHSCEIHRRHFLSASAAALAASVSGFPVRAQASGGSSSTNRIDVHHHFMPQFHLDAVSSTRSGSFPAWSVEKSLEDMDRTGTATAIVSAIQPGVWVGDVRRSRRLAREWNEYATKIAGEHRGRFGVWAALPLPDVEGALREIEYALDTLKASGIGLMTSIAGKYLGDPGFEPVYAELNRRKAVVYTHPLTPDCCRNLVPGTPPSTIEYATDTTRTVASILFSGTAAKFPDMRFILSHSGGTLPFLAGRFERQAATQKYSFLTGGVMPELRKFYYDVAQGNTGPQLAALARLAPISQILFGTDYPFRPGSEAVQGLRDFGFSEADLAAIERDNALALLPRLKT
jgi:6-methylsalicylate decarboxylase